MKNIVIGILLIATAVCGGLYFHQSRKASEAAAAAASLKQQAQELKTSLAQEEQRTTKLRDRFQDVQGEAIVKASRVAQLEQVVTNQTLANARTNAKPSNPLAEMFKNPDMKEMIKTQQKTVISTIVDKNYGKLIADLHLTPEQSTALKDLLLNKQMAGMDMGLSMISDDMDATKRAELAKQVKAEGEAFDAQIKQLLGDDSYAQFQVYEKTQSERTAINGFKDQLGSGPLTLNAGQEEQLIQAMAQERQNFKFTTDFSDQSKLTGDFASMLTEDKLNQFSQEQERLNQQYLARAQSILSPDQMGAYEKFTTNQLAMQKMAMKMAAQMFAPK